MEECVYDPRQSDLSNVSAGDTFRDLHVKSVRNFMFFFAALFMMTFG